MAYRASPDYTIGELDRSSKIMNESIQLAKNTKLDAEDSCVSFMFFHSKRNEQYSCMLEEWIGDGNIETYDVDKGNYTVVGNTDQGDLVLLSKKDGSIYCFTDIDITFSKVSESMAEFIQKLNLEEQ